MKRLYWLALIYVLACEDTQPNRPGPAPRVPSSPAVAPPRAPPTSTAADLDPTPVPVAEERRLRQRRVGKALVIDSEGKWDKSCLIHRSCKVTPRALAPCDAKQNAEPWSALPGKAENFTDPNVSIKGRLVLADGKFSTAVGCGEGQCCNGCSANLRLAGPPYDLELVGLGCGGDESRLCCGLAADQLVIASGRLRYSMGRLRLDSPELCRVVE
jgi:hypothetical protein